MDSVLYRSRRWSACGELTTERDSPNPVTMDCDSGISGVSIDLDLYYHTADQEKRRIFPIDGKIADSRTVTSSLTSTRRGDFHEDVVERDECCVVKGDFEYCDAAHLLPHSKGDRVCDSCMALSTYNLIGGSISRRSPHTDIETPVAMTTLCETSMTFVMVCYSILSYIICWVEISHS
jgi:hypothetical protein